MSSEPNSHLTCFIEAAFAHVADLGFGERSKFLDEICRGDPKLRREIESLVAADAPDDRFIESVIANMAAQISDGGTETPEEEMAGTRIGSYRVLKVIARGGMGTVYHAVREDESRMEVALKVIKRGTDTDFAIKQFKNERQILAQLEHPNIARLLDGGFTTDGLPYLVMEYVRGQPITDYCMAGTLDIPDRLRLFCQSCTAVQYAHQHLIIHRDLKPSNILVTADGCAKLLDFGIAKLLLPKDLRYNSFSLTSVGLRVLTPDYASPEQVRGLPLTTATDIYSLGVILFELVTGRRLLEINTLEVAAIEHAICHGEPRSPASVCKEIDGDLSKIVLMAIRKEPQKRYSSVEQFSDDIRYLEGRPILARKDTVAYRSRKFVSISNAYDKAQNRRVTKLLEQAARRGQGSEEISRFR